MHIHDFKLGQGTWMLGADEDQYASEFEALSSGISGGLTLIDTAEMYADGGSEELIGDVIRPHKRADLFLVSKVYPFNASRYGIRRSCTASLERLGTDYLDLYLLHWPGTHPLEETVAGFEALKREGMIRDWGVSNFDKDGMETLWEVENGANCVTNQVLYNVGSRGIEFDLLPWMNAHDVTLMAYSPLAHSEYYQASLTKNSTLRRLAAKHDASVYQILLAFVMRLPGAVAIPRTGRPAHVADNIASLKIRLDAEELTQIEEAFPAPTRQMPLDVL